MTIVAKAKLSPLQKGLRKLVRDKLKEHEVENLGKADKPTIRKVFKGVKKEWPARKREINKKLKDG